MTTDSHSRTPAPKTIAIVGGGFTGSTIAIQQAQHYAALIKQGHELPPLHLKLIDRDGAFGTGLPYGTQDSVFLLNQPADAMSPFPDDVGHFTRWLGADGNTFATRHDYGVYLKETLKAAFNAVAAAGLPVTLETVQDTIGSLTLAEDRAVLGAAHGNIDADAVIIATGHEKNDFLHDCRTHENFFTSVYSVDEVRLALQGTQADDSIVIIGTGQSMLDALATIDQAAFPGKIYAVSRHGVEPWPYYPEHYAANGNAPYRPAFVTPDALDGKWSYEDLRDAIQKEFKLAQALGYDIGHALTAIDFDALKDAAPEENGLAEFRHHWAKIYGNPSPPQRFALFESYKNDGRLEIVSHAVRNETIEPQEKGYVAHLGGKLGDVRAAAIFNAVAYDQRSLASPLLRIAAAQDALHLSHDGRVAPGQQRDPRLFVAGPPVSPDKWGVETFRDNNAVTARASVDTVFKLQPKQTIQP